MNKEFAELGSVAEFINGAAFKPEDWGDEGKRIIRIQNLTDPKKPYNRTKREVVSKLHVHPGDLLVSWSASLGVFQWNEPEVALLNQHIFRVVPDMDRVDKRYLRHGLEGALLDMQKHLHGATMQHVNRGEFLATKLYLPPLAEQRRIAEVLDRAEALRAKRRAALAELDALTQSLFLDLFGDPVTNPKWPEVMVSDFVAGFESGKSIVADDEEDTTSPYRVLKVSAVTSLEFRPEQSKALPPDYSPPPSHFVRTGDLLFSRANTAELIGATAYVSSTPPNLLLPDKLWRFVWHKTPKADPHFVRFLFQQPKFRREIGQRASGTSGSMKNISQEKVLTIKVGLPPLDLQQEFARRVAAVEKLKQAQRTALAELDALFATLQHRAFRGEL